MRSLAQKHCCVGISLRIEFHAIRQANGEYHRQSSATRTHDEYRTEQCRSSSLQTNGPTVESEPGAAPKALEVVQKHGFAKVRHPCAKIEKNLVAESTLWSNIIRQASHICCNVSRCRVLRFVYNIRFVCKQRRNLQYKRPRLCNRVGARTV